jgi:hypothetical protein
MCKVHEKSQSQRFWKCYIIQRYIRTGTQSLTCSSGSGNNSNKNVIVVVVLVREVVRVSKDQ